MIASTLAFLALGAYAWMAFQQHIERQDRVLRDLGEARAAASQSQAHAGELEDKLARSLLSVSELRDQLARQEQRLTGFREQLASSQARAADLEKEKEAARQTHQGLADQMRAELESKDVTISQLQGKLTVNILDRILFDSGEAVLKSAGDSVLQKIAGILAQHPGLKIHVIGHTDNVPIRVSARSRFTSNWELSTARALAAVRFLTESAGVDPRRVGAVGYGEFRPLADNTTAEGRAQNRRIAVTILADELAGADTVSVVSTNSLAAPPPPAPEADDSAAIK
jgi:chemotaxis protein MotB